MLLSLIITTLKKLRFFFFFFPPLFSILFSFLSFLSKKKRKKEKKMNVVTKVKNAIRHVVEDDDCNLLAIDDNDKWWHDATSDNDKYIDHLHESPKKGTTLLNHIVKRSTMTEEDRAVILTRYTKAVQRCKDPEERLSVMRKLLVRHSPPRRRQQQYCLQLDALRSCWLNAQDVADYGQLSVVGIYSCYAIYLSEDREKSLILLDPQRISISEIFGTRATRIVGNVPRVHRSLNVCVTTTTSPSTTISLVVTDPIFSTLSSYLVNDEMTIEDKMAAMRAAFTMTTHMSNHKVLHGNALTSFFLQTKEGWFLSDYRDTKVVTNEKVYALHRRQQQIRSWIDGTPSWYNQHWDTICLYIDAHEQFKHDSAYGRRVMAVCTGRKCRGDNYAFHSEFDEHTSSVQFTLTMGSEKAAEERMTVTIDKQLAAPRVEWQRDLCVSVVVSELQLLIPKSRMSECGYTLGERLGSGTYSYVFALEGEQYRGQVMKITSAEKAKFGVEYRLHKMAADHGHAAKIHDYFTVVDYLTVQDGVMTTSKLTHEDIVCIVMDRCDKTLRDYLDDAGCEANTTTLDSTKDVLIGAFEKVRDFARSGFMHRDLKGNNIMVDEQTGQAVIIDFGMARHATIGNIVRFDQLYTMVGSHYDDLSDRDDSWMELPPICPSFIYDLLTLYVDLCLFLRLFYRDEVKNVARRSYIKELQRCMITDVLTLIRDASSDSYDAHLESATVNDNDTVTFVYIEKVGDAVYRTVMNTGQHTFANKRYRHA